MLAKIDKTDACWLWTAARDRYGYGVIGVGTSRIERAHRVAYTLWVGVIPDGLYVDHMCHNRMCVNPAHLATVTPAQNQENRAGAQRNGRSGIRGVGWHAGKWTVQVHKAGVNHYGGRYATLEAATEAAIALRCELFSHNVVDLAVRRG
jgi:hypothetical protein